MAWTESERFCRYDKELVFHSHRIHQFIISSWCCQCIVSNFFVQRLALVAFIRLIPTDLQSPSEMSRAITLNSRWHIRFLPKHVLAFFSNWTITLTETTLKTFYWLHAPLVLVQACHISCRKARISWLGSTPHSRIFYRSLENLTESAHQLAGRPHHHQWRNYHRQCKTPPYMMHRDLC